MLSKEANATSTRSSLGILSGTLLICLLVTQLFTQAQAQSDTRLPDAAMNRDISTVNALIADGAAPDTLGQYDTPALHWIVRIDELETTQLLLEAGANPNAETSYGVTPLSLAVNNGSVGIVKLLLEAGADANKRETTGETILMVSALVGVAENVEALLAYGAAVNANDTDYQQTALILAAREGHTEIVRLLLAAGANPNASTSVGETPRWVEPNSQVGFGFGVGIIRGGTPADRGRREPVPGGMSPLLYAARGGHSDIAQLLLDAGAELNHKEANDIYPLLMAISNNNMETARLFLERDTLISDADWYGRTPLWEAINVRNLYMHNATFDNYVTNRDEILSLIDTLLEKGANVDARMAEAPPARHYLLVITGTLEWVDFTGQTPFLAAAYAGDVSVMTRLLEYGADPFISTYAGTSALMAAAGVNWVYAQTWTEAPEQLLEAVKLTIELGLDVNQLNSMGLSALHGAANRGSDDIIALLVEHGADLQALDVEDRSPLDWAKGVFLATHPDEAKPSSVELISRFLAEQGKENR